MGSSDNTQRDRPSMTAVVGYRFETKEDLEAPTDDLLEREIVRAGTPVTQYGTDGLFLWLNGVPGAKLRKVVKQLKALGWTSVPT